jgi:predicted dehydrogenase
MKLLVVGTGSIGKRHIKNLLELGANVLSFSYRTKGQDLDPRVIRVSQLKTFLESDVDAVVIANRTDQHIDVALQAARAGKHMFLEKPLSSSMVGVNELITTVQQNGLVVEAGFMLHSHPNLMWIRQHLAQGLLGEIWHMRAAVGQWLPDWRPDSDYRQGYGAFKALGGGVTFDLIHELDLVQWLLGPVTDVTAMMRQAAALEIETEAVAQIVLRLASGALAQVHLDYLRPCYGREMEIVGRKGVLRWDYVKGVVTLEEAGQVPHVVHRVPEGFVRNRLFLDHMRHFLQRLRSPTLPASSPLEEAAAVLRVALAAHQSAQQRKHVCPLDL